MRNTQGIGQGLLLEYPIAAETQIESGYMVSVNAGGFAVQTGDGDKKVVGVADVTASNEGANGAVGMRVVTGRVFRFFHDGLTQANVGDTVTASDSETVEDGEGTPAGILVGFANDDEVWVWIPPGGIGI